MNELELFANNAFDELVIYYLKVIHCPLRPKLHLNVLLLRRREELSRREMLEIELIRRHIASDEELYLIIRLRRSAAGF